MYTLLKLPSLLLFKSDLCSDYRLVLLVSTDPTLSFELPVLETQFSFTLEHVLYPIEGITEAQHLHHVLEE